MKSNVFLPVALILIVISTDYTDSKPHQPENAGTASAISGTGTAEERQLSFVIPAYGFLGGGGFGNNNVNPASSSSSTSAGIANLLGGIGGLGGVVTRTIFRTVSTVTVATVRTCTVSLAAGAMPCGGRRKRDADGGPDSPDADDVAIEPTMVLVIGSSSITNQKEVSKILGLPNHDEIDVVSRNGSITTLPPGDDLNTTLYPTPSGNNDNDEMVFDAEATTTASLADFWEDVNKFQSAQSVISDDEKARLAFGQSTTTVTVSLTGIAYTTVSSPVFTVAYSGCSPISFPVTSSAC